MSEQERNAEVVRQFADRWNAGDIEGVLELYDDGIEMIPGPEWPDPPVIGKKELATYVEEWRGAWASSTLALHDIEAVANLVVAGGEWDNRSASTGIGGSMPFGVMFTLRDGLVTRHEWCRDLAGARRAAGL
jgi:ketosteroid isomerase-like protein